MKKVNWGIIGCGDVTEVKSGPAFYKVVNSSLVAVMRRDAAKAKEYADRHDVPNWYNNANDLIHDKHVNAIYIATPPSSHFEYAKAAMLSGKPVYVEKPMTLDVASAEILRDLSITTGVKLTVAHYRRMQPMFKKLKELLTGNAIGDVRFVQLEYFEKLLSSEELSVPKTAWRVQEEISGGGLFHDLAPHQLDLMLYFFGDADHSAGISFNQSKTYNAADIVSGNILFRNGVIFNGLWCFNSSEHHKDKCEIVGTEGVISFSVFGDAKIELNNTLGKQIILFEKPEHVQQPMINEVVRYFLGQGPNPCNAEDGVQVMKLLHNFTKQ